MTIIVKPPRYDYRGLSISRYRIISIYCPSLFYTENRYCMKSASTLVYWKHNDTIEAHLTSQRSRNCLQCTSCSDITQLVPSMLTKVNLPLQDRASSGSPASQPSSVHENFLACPPGERGMGRRESGGEGGGREGGREKEEKG